VKIRPLRRRFKTAQDNPAEELKQKLSPGGGEAAPENKGLDLGPAIERVKQKQEEQQKEQQMTAPPESAEEELKTIKNTLNQAELPKAVESMWKSAEEILRENGVQNYGIIKDGLFVEKDGVDIVVNVGSNNIRGATLLFDYSTKWGEEIRNIINNPETLFSTTDTRLNEVVFEVCGLAYAAINPQQITTLLQSIATLQKVDTRPATAAETPVNVKFEGEESTAEAIDWALGVVLQPMLDHNPEALYEDKNNAIGAARKIAEDDNGFLSKEQASDFEKIVKQIDPTFWTNMVKEYKQALLGKQFKPSKAMIEQQINKLTDGKYKGDYLVDYTTDGHLQVTIDAPYPFAFSFVRAPNNLKFFQAGMADLCDKTYVTTNPQLAKALVMADVYLGKFFEQAANPGMSQERSQPKQNIEEVVDEYAKRMKKEFEKAPEVQQKEQWKELADLVDKDPKAFVRYIKENKDAATKFLEANPGFTNYLKTDREQVFNALREIVPGLRGQQG